MKNRRYLLFIWALIMLLLCIFTAYLMGNLQKKEKEKIEKEFVLKYQEDNKKWIIDEIILSDGSYEITAHNFMTPKLGVKFTENIKPVYLEGYTVKLFK